MIRVLALMALLGCGDNDQVQMFCGVANCEDIAAPTVAQCLVNSFVRCTPARGAIVLNGVTRTYEIDLDCLITTANSTSYEICRGLSYTNLSNPTNCPWLILAGCGPTVSRLP